MDCIQDIQVFLYALVYVLEYLDIYYMCHKADHKMFILFIIYLFNPG